MLTASELGMLCAKHRIKSASDLTEGVRSWFTPKPLTPPEMNVTKDQKPQAQPNPYAKSSEQPFSAAKGLPKANPTQSTMPFASGSAKAQEAAQAAARPQYDYFRPPTGHVKTQIKPYEYFKDLYKDYPGGYQGAIDHSQRWREHAQLDGLQTWKPEDLQQPVDVRGGNLVGPWESRQAPLLAAPRGFTSPTDPIRAGAYAAANRNFNFPRGQGAVMMNPSDVNEPASSPSLRSILGHELTHEIHRRNNYLGGNLFKGYESKFPEHLSGRGTAGVGGIDDPQSMLDYMGDPSEFGAYSSELRRHWIQNNPGKALDKIPAAEALLQHYNPARPTGERGDTPVPNINDFQELLPTIMSNPELKKKAILQILHSVVQNKQRQAGTNV